MKSRRSLAFIACIILIASSIAGCNGSPSDVTPGTTPGSATITSPASGPIVEKFDPPITISMVRYTTSTMEADLAKTTNHETSTDNRFNKLFLEKLGINLTYEWVAKDDAYGQKLNLALASGKLPDFVAVSSFQVKQLHEAGLIQDMTQVYKDYASAETKAKMETEGTGAFRAVTHDKKLMAIPSTWGSFDRTQFIWIRNDWMKKLGLKAPESMEDVIRIAEEFTKNDPDGNGKNDTFGLGLQKDFRSSTGGIIGFVNGYNAFIDTWVPDENGQLVLGDVQPNMKTALLSLHDMYKNGYISPEFGVADTAKIASQIANNQVGMFYGEHWMPLYPLQDSYNLNPNAEWKAYSIVGVGGASVKNQLPLGTNNFWVAKKTVKNPEAIMMMIDLQFNNTDPYYGRSEDAPNAWWFSPIQIQDPYINVKTLDAIQGVLNGADETKLGPTDSGVWTQIKKFKSGETKYWNMWSIYGEVGNPIFILKDRIEKDMFFRSPFVAPPTDTMVKKGATLLKLKDTVYTKIIIEDGGAAVYDKFVNDWKNLGGTEITKEINDWYRQNK
jgi:putative aldouronate transport system substrate-binding protein